MAHETHYGLSYVVDTAVKGAALSGYVEVATQLRLDPRAMLREAGVDVRALQDPEFRVPARRVYDLLERSAQASGCETFGLRMAQARRPGQIGPIALLLAHQPTLRDALKVLAGHQRTLNEALLIAVDDDEDGSALMRLDLVADGDAPLRQAYELALATAAQTFRGPAGPRLRAKDAFFAHGPPADLSDHRRLFGPHLHFGSAFNGLSVSRVDADRPNPAADADLAGYAAAFLESLTPSRDAPLEGRVRMAILALLPSGRASSKAVAARLGLSDRTMQRHLARDGVEFVALLGQIRRDHAVRHLANGKLPLSEVAELLGYARESSFARWFSGEFGLAPSAWRAANGD